MRQACSTVPMPPLDAQISAREAQIVQATKDATAIFDVMVRIAATGLDLNQTGVGDMLAQFRWHFLAGFCTRALTKPPHRLDQLPLQATMDVFSAVTLTLAGYGAAVSELHSAEQGFPINHSKGFDLGQPGFQAGWAAALARKKGLTQPIKVEYALLNSLHAASQDAQRDAAERKKSAALGTQYV